MKFFFLKVVFLTFLYTIPTYAGDQDTMIDDFTKNSDKRWEFFTDQVMGGVSEGTASILSDNNGSYVRLEGSVSTANNGGFIQFRRKILDRFDSNYKGIQIEVRGNNQEYFIHIRTIGTILPWQYYQAPFIAYDKWETQDIKLIEFKRSGIMLAKKINPKNIKSIAIVAYGKEHEAFIDVNNIIIY